MFYLIVLFVFLLNSGIQALDHPEKESNEPELPYQDICIRMRQLEKLNDDRFNDNTWRFNKGKLKPFSISMEEMPPEIIIRILDYIRELKTQLSFLLSSKNYMQFADNIVETVISDFYFKENERRKKFPLFFNKLEKLKYLYIEHSNLREAEINHKNIIGLTIKRSHIEPSFILNQTSLRYLDIRTTPWVLSFFSKSEGIELKKITENNPNLAVLRLTVYKIPGPTKFSRDRLKNLKMLELVRYDPKKIDIIKAAVNAQLLEILILSDYGYMMNNPVYNNQLACYYGLPNKCPFEVKYNAFITFNSIDKEFHKKLSKEYSNGKLDICILPKLNYHP